MKKVHARTSTGFDHFPNGAFLIGCRSYLLQKSALRAFMGHDEALGSGRPEILADFRALAVFRKKPFCAVGGLPMKRISHYFFGRDSCHRLLKGGGLAALQKSGRTRVQQDWLQGASKSSPCSAVIFS